MHVVSVKVLNNQPSSLAQTSNHTSVLSSWPEIPLLTSTKQHWIQRSGVSKRSDTQCTYRNKTVTDSAVWLYRDSSNMICKLISTCCNTTICPLRFTVGCLQDFTGHVCKRNTDVMQLCLIIIIIIMIIMIIINLALHSNILLIRLFAPFFVNFNLLAAFSPKF